ncbi:hypothetical protein N657DRAFT_649362 [Parathielavia appendiculata]|uniref:Uncharacterized protein n=1 Tax=Parathielavia appendiculata TaxID=2587402 RepID=A0AAN6Z0B8_9PEZI|nr:hypothetical protein N657DRAFT_649362 [Parathielavia appendiculata]
MPASGIGGAKKINEMRQIKPPSTAPAALCDSKPNWGVVNLRGRKQGIVDVDVAQQPKQQEFSTAAPQTPTRAEDCIWVAITSKTVTRPRWSPPLLLPSRLARMMLPCSSCRLPASVKSPPMGRNCVIHTQ